MASEKPTGVFFLNMGGPDSLRAVKPFLFNLFSDRMIIRLGPEPLQRPLARFISARRAPKAREAYALIGGKSPILELTKAQARALEESLAPEGDFRVYTGMRYWHPFIIEELARMKKDRVEKFIALSLYPQYSMATSGSSFKKLEDDAEGFGFLYREIRQWHLHPKYIAALSDTLRKGMEAFGEDVPYVLFSAHGLPVKFIEMGDPYERQTRETVEAVTREAGVEEYSLSYQSRTGPVKWLGPSTDEKIKELAAKGVRNLLVLAVSFVSDHIETLYEIDILYKRLAAGLGMRLERARALNTHPLLIGALKDLTLEKKREAGW